MNSEEQEQKDQDQLEDQQSKSSFFSVIQSTLAGLFGIQSEKNRQEDFNNGSAMNYIVSGIIGVVLLLVGMKIFVSAVVNSQ